MLDPCLGSNHDLCSRRRTGGIAAVFFDLSSAAVSINELQLQRSALALSRREARMHGCPGRRERKGGTPQATSLLLMLPPCCASCATPNVWHNWHDRTASGFAVAN